MKLAEARDSNEDLVSLFVHMHECACSLYACPHIRCNVWECTRHLAYSVVFAMTYVHTTYHCVAIVYLNPLQDQQNKSLILKTAFLEVSACHELCAGLQAIFKCACDHALL